MRGPLATPPTAAVKISCMIHRVQCKVKFGPWVQNLLRISGWGGRACSKRGAPLKALGDCSLSLLPGSRPCLLEWKTPLLLGGNR